MAFPPGFLDELRNRISLAELIGRQIKLTRRGREFVGLCPFHHEKTPSFSVVEAKGFFHCFGCGAHGDAIGFVMRADHLDFLDAVERLAATVGLAVPKATPQEREQAQRQKTLLEVLEAAAAFYERGLWSPGGRPARDYLAARGLDVDTIRRFRLGWASDDRQALRRSLAADYPPQLLTEAGLLRHPEAGEPFDYFGSRVIFPIGDRTGRVIAFGGRVIPGSSSVTSGLPKYLNSPEHPLFEKGRVLYGWSAARDAGTDSPGPIVTEGYMDVIALHRAGFHTAVAPLGTALTEFQLQGLWRLGPEPVLCFDGDEAGQRAALRALHRALPLLRPGHTLRFATLPTGQDPDSLIRRGGPPAFERVMAAARPLSDMLWESEVRGSPRDTPERLAKIQSRLQEHVQKIADPRVKSEFATLFKRRCDPWQVKRRAGLRKSSVRDGPPPPPRPPARRQREILFHILLRFPALLDEVVESFAALEIPEPALAELKHEILDAHVVQPGLDASSLRQHLVMNGFAAAVDALLSHSVDTGFLNRRSELSAARSAWAHVVGMLMRGDAPGATEAANLPIDDAWFEQPGSAAGGQALRQNDGTA